MFKPIPQLKSYHHFRYLQNVNVKLCYIWFDF
jgi:hypothetical protein